MGNSTDTITVQAFGARYLAAYRKVAPIEGGHSNDPDDRGGETNLGVSLRFLRAEGLIDLDGDGIADFDLDMDGDLDGADIRLLKPIDAKMLFQRCFWNRLGCDAYPLGLGEAMFDQAVNGGLGAAKKLLQRAINKCTARVAHVAGCPAPLKDDGAIGTATRAALDWALKLPSIGVPALLAAYRLAADERYRAIAAADPSQRKWLNGWQKRAATLGVL
ncbi:glycosyl hydrolase 108 family protein [Sphingomonas hengshuiensis]|uniref:glycosyl hydrolase 108 family protein n=1 Tax=Sphingomonas hengshuiensis TaxID=1609977 RepID=UPI0006967784|nr:glycosyl hydrolase 108 family protein [Sphingomonas hengshuiensis]